MHAGRRPAVNTMSTQCSAVKVACQGPHLEAAVSPRPAFGALAHAQGAHAVPAAAAAVLAGADGVQAVADAGSAALGRGHRQDLAGPKAPVGQGLSHWGAVAEAVGQLL